MRGRYSVKSDRYNRIHAFVMADKGSDLYWFEPEEKWMPLSITYKDKTMKSVLFVDTDGGPLISVGWSNDEIEVLEIIEDTKSNRLLFRLKEKN